MTRRVLALIAAAWTIAFGGVYLAVIRSQDDGDPAWWFLGVLAVVVGLAVAGALAPNGQPWLIGCLVLLSICTLLGLLTIGLLLLPAVVLTIVALVVARPRDAVGGHDATGRAVG